MTSAPSRDLGQRLRELRDRNNWRIADVSRLSGLAASTISKVENGRMSLTYDKLQQLAKGLSIDIGELFRDGAASAAPSGANARRSWGRASDGVLVKAGSYEYRFLGSDLVPKSMVPIEGLVLARTLEEFGELIRHEGEEFTYVLEGTMVVHTEFYAPLTLRTGEYIYLDSRMGHAYLTADERPARIVSICTGARSEALQSAVQKHWTEPSPSPAREGPPAASSVRSSGHRPTPKSRR